jgi:hypothetical protein
MISVTSTPDMGSTSPPRTVALIAPADAAGDLTPHSKHDILLPISG